MLSATLTATDTISVLSLIKKKKFPKVHSIILGEGIINDSVAVIFYQISARMKTLNEEILIFNFGGLCSFLYEFAVVTGLSVFVGLLLCHICFYCVV